jgi:hypothetical protein
MDVFLSYASEDRALAERDCRVLEGEGHDDFFDREDLGGGDAFGERIRLAMARADVLVYLISRSSVAPKSYALTELSIAEGLSRRNRPALLPVRTDDTPIDAVPATLRAFTILEPQGDAPAEIANAIDRLRGQKRQRYLKEGAIGVLVVALAAGVYAGVRWFTTPSPALNTTAGGTNTTSSPGASTSSAAPSDPVEAYNEAVLNRTPTDKRVTLIAMPGNNGWTAVLTLADLGATQVSYRLDDAATFTDTGSSGIINTMTGQPRPNTTVRIPGEFWRRRELAVKYTDAKGVEHGPYPLHFDPRAEFLRFTRQALAAIDWLTISELSPGQRVAYFTTLVSYKAAFKEIRYSIDSDAFDQVWPLKVNPSEGWPPNYADERLYVPVPAAARFINVKVVYVDGSTDSQRVDVGGSR